MLVELKDKSQVTIPKAIINELGLSRGDKFDVVVDNGAVKLIPVVVYPKDKMQKLEALAEAARKDLKNGKTKLYDDVEELIVDLHREE